MTSRRVSSLLALFVLWGCGLKGDLYIPEPESGEENEKIESERTAGDAETDTSDGRDD